MKDGSGSSSSDEVISEYRDEVSRSSVSDDLREAIEKKVERSDIVEEVEFFDCDEETYVFRPGGVFRAIFECDASEKLRLVFKERGSIEEEKEDGSRFKKRMYLEPYEESSGRVVFETQKLFLNPNKYGIDLVDVDGKCLLKNLPIKVVNRDRKEIPDKAIFVENDNDDSEFPEDDFLLLNSSDSSLKEKGNCVIVERMVLWEIDEAFLFRDGSFEEKVSGDDIWCLVDEV